MKKPVARGKVSNVNPGGSTRTRRDSMLILDLQTKKKQVLRDILQCREELVSLDRSEITELTRSAKNQSSRGSEFEDEEDRLSVRLLPNPCLETFLGSYHKVDTASVLSWTS